MTATILKFPTKTSTSLEMGAMLGVLAAESKEPFQTAYAMAIQESILQENSHDYLRGFLQAYRRTEAKLNTAVDTTPYYPAGNGPNAA